MQEYVPAMLSLIGVVLVAVINGLFAKQRKATEGEWNKVNTFLAQQKEAQEEQEASKARLLVLLVSYAGAVMELSEANAIALRDGRTNGEMKRALERADQVRERTRKFLGDLGIQSLYE